MAPVVALCWGGAAVAQDDPAEFYRGRTISIHVGLPPGGSFDAYARLIAAHLPRYVPGEPGVIVQNMPGAGSLRAANFVYAVAPQDGTAIGAMSSNVPLQPLTEPRGVRYDLSKINWLPTPARSPNTLVVWHTSAVKRFEDLRQREAVIGSLAPGSSPTIAISLYKHVLGAKVRAVLGYNGLPEAIIAMERGEIDGYPTIPFDTLQRVYAEQWKSGKLRVLAQNGEARLSELSDVPTMVELASGDADKRLISLATMTSRMTFPYIMGPDVPRPRVDAIRAAMTRMYADESFRKDAAARQMMVDPVSTEQVEHLIREAYTAPPEVVQRLKDIVALQGQ
jgi:tripartite-type tricarboxylate transporter receptor subunit TctC